MESFPKPLKLEFIDNPEQYRRRFKLTNPFEYHFPAKDGSPDCVHVPTDYPTDFASVPRVFWPIFPPVARYGKAAVIHDYLCDHPEIRKRQDADLIFKRAMQDLGVAPWKIFFIYGAVSYWTRLITVRRWLFKILNIRHHGNNPAI